MRLPKELPLKELPEERDAVYPGNVWRWRFLQHEGVVGRISGEGTS